MKASDFTIIRNRRRRRISFSVSGDGNISIHAPEGMPDAELLKIAENNLPAIERLRRRAAKRGLPEMAKFEAGEEFFLWGERYPLRLSHRLTAFDGAFIFPAGTPESLCSAFEKFYRNALRRYISGRIYGFAERAGVHFERLRISGADTRWGSCSSSGTISFSWKLAQCPVQLIDYVIWHELTHLKEMNHSPRFWRLLEEYLPGAKTLQKELHRFGRMCPQFPRSSRG